MLPIHSVPSRDVGYIPKVPFWESCLMRSQAAGAVPWKTGRSIALRECIFPLTTEDPNPSGEAFRWDCSFLAIVSFVPKTVGTD